MDRWNVNLKMRSGAFSFPLLCLLYSGLTLGVPTDSHDSRTESTAVTEFRAAPHCFPSLGFHMPSSVPHDSELEQWWCDPATEYAFVGFSYEVTACMFHFIRLEEPSHVELILSGQTRSQLTKEFMDIRHHFKSRYVRLYGACDREGF